MAPNFIWLALTTTTNADNVVAILGAVSALLVALGTFVTVIVAQYKIWVELKRNTRVSEVAAITSVATHEIVHEGVTNDGSASGSFGVAPQPVNHDGGNGP